MRCEGGINLCGGWRGEAGGPTKDGREELGRRANANVIQQVRACIIDGQHGAKLQKKMSAWRDKVERLSK
jgi:hypothetical protein